MKLTRKSIGRIAASFVATAMLATMAIVPASAADYADDLTSISFTKTINMTAASGATVPNAIYTYAIAAGDAVDATETTPQILPGVGTPTIGSAQFTSADAIADSEVVKTVTVDFANVTFTAPGIYRYEITETDPTVVGLTTDGENTLYLDVYVENGTDGLEITHYQMTTSADAPTVSGGEATYTGKFTGDEDAYTTYTLTVTKKVDGAMADANKDYDFTIDFSHLSNGTKVTVDGTQVDAGAVNGSLSVSGIELNPAESQTNGDKVTITGVPGDAMYQVIEALAASEGYTVTAQVGEGSETKLENVDGEYATTSASMGSTNVNVTVTNTRESSTPTGIMMDIAPYAVLVVIAAAGCFIFLRKRHAKED